MDLRPQLEPIWAAFSLPAVVTPPLAGAVSARGVWITPQTVEGPLGGEMRIAEPRRTLVFLRAEVPSIPRDSRVVVAEHLGGPAREWRVDGFGRTDSEFIEVLVVPTL